MEAGPFGWALQFRYIPRPHFVGPVRQELGLGIGRMASLTPALADLALGGEKPVHGTDRAKIAAFIEQRGEHRGRRHVRVTCRDTVVRRRTRSRYTNPRLRANA